MYILKKLPSVFALSFAGRKYVPKSIVIYQNQHIIWIYNLCVIMVCILINSMKFNQMLFSFVIILISACILTKAASGALD